MDFQAITTLLRDKLGAGIILDVDEKATPSALLVPTERIAEIGQLLYEEVYFDYLACITALDNGPEAGTLEVVYNLYSIPHNTQLMLKVGVARNEAQASPPEVPSVSHLWQSANWHEREAYDLMGIKFTGHPDLRRILMPADWQGHPLRKNYEAPQQYHGIEVN